MHKRETTSFEMLVHGELIYETNYIKPNSLQNRNSLMI